jgi:uncharacterized membrane protein
LSDALQLQAEVVSILKAIELAESFGMGLGYFESNCRVSRGGFLGSFFLQSIPYIFIVINSYMIEIPKLPLTIIVNKV